MFRVLYGAKRRCRKVECPVCGKSYFQLLDGTPRTCSQSCARKGEWKSGVHDYQKVDVRYRDGYRLKRCYGHPRAEKNGWVSEHVLVMEQKLGRHLILGEYVHHKNGNRSENDPENLELWRGRKDPPGQRWSDLIEVVLCKLSSFNEAQKTEVRQACLFVFGS